MTKNQIEISTQDISAIEKPLDRARLVKAPENFLSKDFISEVNANGLDENRRGFLRKSFLTAAAAGVSGD